MAAKKEITRNTVPLSQRPRPTAKAEKGGGFWSTVHGKGTDSVTAMIGEEIAENKINNTGVIESGKAQLVLDEFNKLTGKKFGVSADKLLKTIIARFTELNHTGHSTKKIRQTDIIIPLREYALRCGYDIEIHETATPEEAEREAKRAENKLKDARKKINRDLRILYAASLSWSEKRGDYMDVRLIEGKGIRNGNIHVRLAQAFSEYLINCPLTKYPTALLAMDERNSNAYCMAVKMSTHYNMDNNQERGTAQLLKVKTLLEYVKLPSLADCKRLGKSWTERIKEPFELSLEKNVQDGILTDWRYSRPRGEELSDEEATNFPDFDKWANTLIYFTLKDAPDHTERLARKAEAKAKITKKKSR